MVSSKFFNLVSDESTFVSTAQISSKPHCAVWLKDKLGVWGRLDTNKYDLINNTIVTNTDILAANYTIVEIRVADNVDELETAISDIAVVAGLSDKIATVSGISKEIITVADIKEDIVSLYSDKETLDSLYADKPILDSIYIDKAKLDSIYADKAKLDSIYTDKITLDSLFADKVQFDLIYANIAEILLADDNAINSKLEAWNAEAEKKTADSYANEAKDVFVVSYTSNGDGTFTGTNTTEYSALHWQTKASYISGGSLLVANNLSDLDDVAASRVNLGLEATLDNAGLLSTTAFSNETETLDFAISSVDIDCGSVA